MHQWLAESMNWHINEWRMEGSNESMSQWMDASKKWSMLGVLKSEKSRSQFTDSSIHWFLNSQIQDWTDWIQIDTKSHYTYVYKHVWRVETPKSHPFTAFGRHFARETSSPRPMISTIFDGLFPRSRRFKRTNEWDDLLELENSLPETDPIYERVSRPV